VARARRAAASEALQLEIAVWVENLERFSGHVSGGKSLFVDAPDWDERFSRSDCLSFLHSMRAPRWRCAA
jgi:hypothetical protein